MLIESPHFDRTLVFQDGMKDEHHVEPKLCGFKRD